MKKIILYLIGLLFVFALMSGCKNDSLESNEKLKDEIVYNGKWGTASPILFYDNDYGQLYVIAKGEYSYKITDDSLSNSETIEDSIRMSILSTASIVISKTNKSFSSLKDSVSVLESIILEKVNDSVMDGIEITEVEILSLDLTEDSKNTISKD